MRFQRIKTGILAGVMAMSLAAPAFAATDPLAPSLTISSTTQLPTINMQMPTSPAVVLNPYKLTVTIDKAKVTDQIASSVMSVTNLSDCPIQVGVKASAKVAGSIALANATTVGTSPSAADKLDVFIQLKGEVADKAGTALSDSATALTLSTVEADLDTTSFATGTVENVNKSTASTTNTLKAATNGKVAADKGVFNFTFTGDACTTGSKSWTAKDTVTPTVVFQFTPLADMPS